MAKYKMAKKERKATKERVRRYRERQAQKIAIETVTQCVTDEEIDKLPQGEKAEIARITGIMAACGIDNLRERQEVAVRRLRGY